MKVKTDHKQRLSAMTSTRQRAPNWQAVKVTRGTLGGSQSTSYCASSAVAWVVNSTLYQHRQFHFVSASSVPLCTSIVSSTLYQHRQFHFVSASSVPLCISIVNVHFVSASSVTLCISIVNFHFVSALLTSTLYQHRKLPLYISIINFHFVSARQTVKLSNSAIRCLPKLRACSHL